MLKSPLKQVAETETTREFVVKDYRIILNWEDQTATVIKDDPLLSEEMILPIFLVAFILQRFGGFRIALNASDWSGPKGVWAKAAEESKCRSQLP